MKEYNYEELIREQVKQTDTRTLFIQCVEEMAELTQALCKVNRWLQGDKTLNYQDYNALLDHVYEEFADTEIMLDKIKCDMLYADRIEEIKREKLERTQQRMEQETKPHWVEQTELISCIGVNSKEIKEKAITYYTCSECGYKTTYKWFACSNCGAELSNACPQKDYM